MLNAIRNSGPSGRGQVLACTLTGVNPTRRKPLEAWQREDAARLKALFESASPETQESFGATHGVGSQSLVWQYLNGYIPLNLRAAIRFARGLQCRVADFSPTLAADLPPESEPHDDAFETMVGSMPPSDAQQVLDFILYKVERTEHLMTRDQAARYSRWIERISEDLKARKAADKPS